VLPAFLLSGSVDLHEIHQQVSMRRLAMES